MKSYEELLENWFCGHAAWKAKLVRERGRAWERSVVWVRLLSLLSLFMVSWATKVAQKCSATWCRTLIMLQARESVGECEREWVGEIHPLNECMCNCHHGRHCNKNNKDRSNKRSRNRNRKQTQTTRCMSHLTVHLHTSVARSWA